MTCFQPRILFTKEVLTFVIHQGSQWQYTVETAIKYHILQEKIYNFESMITSVLLLSHKQVFPTLMRNETVIPKSIDKSKGRGYQAGTRSLLCSHHAAAGHYSSTCPGEEVQNYIY